MANTLNRLQLADFVLIAEHKFVLVKSYSELLQVDLAVCIKVQRVEQLRSQSSQRTKIGNIRSLGIPN